jgi:hypothetical protein
MKTFKVDDLQFIVSLIIGDKERQGSRAFELSSPSCRDAFHMRFSASLYKTAGFREILNYECQIFEYFKNEGKLVKPAQENALNTILKRNLAIWRARYTQSIHKLKSANKLR